jgi:hypothetical protein
MEVVRDSADRWNARSATILSLAATRLVFRNVVWARSRNSIIVVLVFVRCGSLPFQCKDYTRNTKHPAKRRSAHRAGCRLGNEHGTRFRNGKGQRFSSLESKRIHEIHGIITDVGIQVHAAIHTYRIFA